MPIVLAACSFVPTSGPTVEQFDKALADRNPLGLRVIDLTPAVLQRIVAAPPAPMPAAALGPAKAVGRVGVGDVLAVSIFETAPALFSPTTGVPSLGIPASGASSATASPESGATLTNLPPLEVAKDGTILMPYGGSLRVAGLTPAEVTRKIVARLRNKSIAPQVMVDVRRNVENTVFVSGDVKSPGRYPLDLEAERLLDMLALAGGATNSPYDDLVRVIRGNTRAEFRLSEATALGSYNIVLSPGDRIEVESRPRTFTVFGSAGRVSEIDFKNPNVTLAEGLARANAAPGFESDSTGVYLFRLEKPTVMRALGVATTNEPVPVIYRVDLMDPTSYALLLQFRMRNKDLVYIANARSVPIQKFLNLIAAMFTPLAPAAAARQIAE
ncbi:MAG TPA: polysaccharide biosynthesis/export family protein [Xanthobacteraceae bacterium]|nr:polysaccharide biosynthesis/export family protein [Xanthobacteraceae bacterium]